MGKRLLWSVVLVLVGGVVACGAATDDTDDIEVGRCMAENRSADRGEVPYRDVPCGDAAAKFVVLRQFPRETGYDRCPAEPGTSRWFSAGDRTTCLSRKGVDPKTAVNVAKEGDCLTSIASSEEPLRLGCADPRATLRVLRRHTEVSKFNAHDRYCDVIPGATANYGWNWIADDGFLRSVDEISFDVLLCLGPKNMAVPPTRPGSPDSEDEPRSNCSYLDANEVAAVLTRVARRSYTVASTTDRRVECAYIIVGGGTVYVAFDRRTSTTPPSHGENFTVDGLAAHYAGNWLTVYTHPNRSFRAIVHLNDADDDVTKAVAVAVFRAARPRLV